MGIWKSPTSVDLEKQALEEKQREIQRQIQNLQNQVQNLAQNKSDPKPQVFQEEEILPLEGHHPYHTRKKEVSPSLRSHQNRDRNFFFLFTGVFVFFIYLILRFWK